MKTQNIILSRQAGMNKRIWLAAAAGCVALWTQSAAAESRTYVVEWFAGATYNQPNDCTKGVNVNIEFQYKRDLAALGYTEKQIEDLHADGNESELTVALTNRGRLNGVPVNAYTNPATVIDPELSYVGGKGSKYAYGFNLDGKGATDPTSFEEPVTKEKGVDNQMFRALGCFEPFRGSATERASQWDYTWAGLRPGMQAWLITIAGEDLGKDGDATITIEKSQDHVTIDSRGNVQRDMSFRIDPDERSRNVIPAKITNGTLTATEHGNFSIISGEIFMFPMFTLRNTHLRMTMNPDGTLEGLLGGYQPWLNFYAMSSSGAYTFESSLGVDAPGLYHLLRRLADANPDPTTGQNRDISTAYKIEAVPAFITPAADGKTARGN